MSANSRLGRREVSTMTFVRADDWEGIYINGKLVEETHSIENIAAVNIAIRHKVTTVETKWCDLDWIHDEGNLPQKLEDVKLEVNR